MATKPPTPTAAAGRYKEHACPKCNVLHRGRGPYCTKSCANLDRSEEVKKKLSDTKKYGDKGQLATWELNWGIDYEPIIAGPPVGLNDNQFVEGGDVWTSDDPW